jgi:hypothetical protein
MVSRIMRVQLRHFLRRREMSDEIVLAIDGPEMTLSHLRRKGLSWSVIVCQYQMRNSPPTQDNCPFPMNCLAARSAPYIHWTTSRAKSERLGHETMEPVAFRFPKKRPCSAPFPWESTGCHCQRGSFRLVSD